MENDEIKNGQTEELNDEALDEVTGGACDSGSYVLKDSKIADAKTLQATQPKRPGEIAVPTVPGLVGQRKF